LDISLTSHARARQQQRGVSTEIQRWLIDYGDKTYDGHGAVLRYFSKRSLKRVVDTIGTDAVRRHHEDLRCYLVQDATDGCVITVGKRFKQRRIRRR
jgi:hypothetical protein